MAEATTVRGSGSTDGVGKSVSSTTSVATILSAPRPWDSATVGWTLAAATDQRSGNYDEHPVEPVEHCQLYAAAREQ